ncbi:hypothetical protein HKX48_005611 [Thoreauomyces humboldtii]|nr:hypothetical protein HKX48_005611 [Thoreauomyces humboldtii]
MNSISTFTRSEPMVWTARIVFFVVAAVFADTVSRLIRMDSEVLHQDNNNPLGELQQKAKLVCSSYNEDLSFRDVDTPWFCQFYTQRNLYLSLFAIFMVLVDYRRVRDVYLQLVYQEQIAEQTKKVRLLTQQIGSITGVDSAVKASIPKVAGKTDGSAAPESSAVSEIQMETLPTGKVEILRKRGTTGDVALD